MFWKILFTLFDFVHIRAIYGSQDEKSVAHGWFFNRCEFSAMKFVKIFHVTTMSRLAKKISRSFLRLRNFFLFFRSLARIFLALIFSNSILILVFSDTFERNFAFWRSKTKMVKFVVNSDKSFRYVSIGMKN